MKYTIIKTPISLDDINESIVNKTIISDTESPVIATIVSFKIDDNKIILELSNNIGCTGLHLVKYWKFYELYKNLVINDTVLATYDIEKDICFLKTRTKLFSEEELVDIISKIEHKPLTKISYLNI